MPENVSGVDKLYDTHIRAFWAHPAIPGGGKGFIVVLYLTSYQVSVERETGHPTGTGATSR